MHPDDHVRVWCPLSDERADAIRAVFPGDGAWGTFDSDPGMLELPLGAPETLLRIDGVRVTAVILTDGDGVRSGALRELPLTQLGIELSGARMSAPREPQPPALDLGSPRDGDAFFARVADAWQTLYREGFDQPTRELAALTGRSTATVQRWVKEARELGLIPAELKGRSGPPKRRR